MTALDQLTQSPGCNYDYQLQLLYVPDNTGTEYPPPSEIRIDQGKIYIEKCLPGDSDPSCTQAPYGKVYPMIIRVFLDDGNIDTPSQQSVDIDITAVLLNNCLANEISLTDTLTLIEYYMSTPSVPFEYMPSLIATHTYCPVTCGLFGADGSSYSSVTTTVQSFSQLDLMTVIRTTNK